MRSTTWNGGSLWSAGARDRFGSHFRFQRLPGLETRAGLISIIAGVYKWTTKAVPSARTPKAPPIRFMHTLQLFVPRRRAMAHKMVLGCYHAWPGPIDGESEPVESDNVRSPMKFDC